MYSVFWRNHLWDPSTWVLRHDNWHTFYVNRSLYFTSPQDIPYHRMQGALPGPVTSAGPGDMKGSLSQGDPPVNSKS